MTEPARPCVKAPPPRSAARTTPRPAFWIRQRRPDLRPRPGQDPRRQQAAASSATPTRPRAAAAAARRRPEPAARAGQRRERVVPPRGRRCWSSTTRPTADAFTLEIRNTCAPEKNTAAVGPVHQRRRLLHAVRGRGLPPHHLLPRPARRDGGLHRHAARRQGAVPGAAVQRQPGRAGRPGRRPPLRQVARPASPSPATCLRWWPADLVAREQRIRTPRRPRPPAAGLRAPRRPGQDRARDELADRQRWSGTKRASACRWTWTAS